MAAGDLALNILITASGASAISAMGGVSESANRLGGLLKTAVVAGAVAAGAALIAFGVSSVKAAADFQQTMIKTSALAGVASQDIDSLSASIMQMAVATGQGPQKLAEGLYYIASAGFSAKDSLKLLELSAKAASTGMVDTETTANALTTVMKAFNIPIQDATKTMDIMTATVSQGKTEWKDFAPVIGIIAVNAKQAGIRFTDASSAFAVLTNVMGSSKQAKDSLDALLQTSSKFDVLNTRAHAMGLTFDENKYKTLDLAGRLQYLQQVTGGNTQEMTKLLGRQNAVAASTDLLTNHMSDYDAALKKIVHSSGATQDAFQKTQAGFNQQSARLAASMDVLKITIGNALLPMLTHLAEAVTPIVMGFASWVTSGHAVSDLLSVTGKYAQIALPILAGLGALILTLIVPAFWAWAGAMLANPLTWIIAGIVLAVALLTAAFVHFYQTSAPFRAFLDGVGKAFGQIAAFIQANFLPALQMVGAWLQTHILPTLQQVGAFLVSTFAPVWQQLVSLWNSQLLPALKQLWAAIQPLMPLFGAIAVIIGVIVVVAFGLLIGVIKGIVMALGGFLGGLATVITGVVTFVTGIVQVVTGIVSFISDLLTGHFSKLGADLGIIWQGVLNIFSGIWTAICGVFQAAIGIVIGFVSGLVSGVVGFFTGLWHTLVGGSIVPDMINGIISWFAQLPGRVIAFVISLYDRAVQWFNVMKAAIEVKVTVFVNNVVTSFSQLVSRGMSALAGLPGQLGNLFSNLAGQAVSWGVNLIQGFINGIASMVGNVANAAGNIVGTVKNFLGFHSPTKEGPGQTAHLWAPALIDMYTAGMLDGVPRIRAAASALAGAAAFGLQPTSSSFALSGAGSGSNAFALGGGSSGGQGTINMTIYLDGREITKVVGMQTAREMRIQGTVRNR